MKTAVYPGTFDPITNGHLDILQRALNLFDKVIVGVAKSDNRNKKPLFSLEERMQLVKEAVKEIGLKNVEIKPFSNLLVEFVKENNSKIIIRGLRAVSDFDYELQYDLTNRTLNPEVDTVFIMTSTKYLFLSSNIVREIASLHGKVSEFVPKCVEKRLVKKFSEKWKLNDGRI